MASIRDICRICVQEVYDQDFQEINVNKLRSLLRRPFLGYIFMRKWEPEFFQDHLICNSCIENFRRMKIIYRNSYKTNTIISLERSKHKLLKINLKRLKRFSHLEGDFIVCRICLEPTSQIAIYLYDNNKNILPLKYIEAMLRHIRIYTNFSRTINPIMCHLCWQNLQTSYSFTKHLEMVTEKIVYYQSLVTKLYINREDLQEAFDIWDHLNVTDNQKEVLIKKEVVDETYEDTPEKLKSSIIKIKQEYFCPENEYVKNLDESKSKNGTDKFEPRQCTNEEAFNKMPRLIVHIESNFKNVGSPKNKQEKKYSDHKITNGQQAKNTEISTDETKKTILKKMDFSHSENECNPNISKNKLTFSKKLRSANQAGVPALKTYAHVDQKTISPIPKTNKNKKNNLKNKNKPIKQCLKPMTRLSLKKETPTDDFMKDLLIVRKEEIIKDTQKRKKPKLNPPNYSSTPNMTSTSNKQNTSLSSIEYLPSKSTIDTEYTFETLNLNEEVKKEVIEEEEIQIKREVVSECDTDDDFNESKDVQFNDNCPNLVSFIKSEPLDLTDLDEDQPPELEFQGLCSSHPALFSSFTIQNTYTVDEKRNLINAYNEKESPLSATVIDAGNMINNGEIRNVMTPSRNKRPDLLTSPKITCLKVNKKFGQQRLAMQVKKDVLKNTNLPDTIKNENSPRLEQVGNNSKVTDTNIKFNHPLSTKQPLDAFLPIDTQTDKQKLISDALFELEYRQIGAETPFACEMCDFSTKSSHAAKCHLSMHCSNTLHLYNCGICAYTTTTQPKLKRHLEEHVSNICIVCKDRIPTKSIQRKYNRSFHARCLISIESYPEISVCKYCEKPFDHNVVVCKKCKSFMHRSCFVLDRTEMKFNCLHYAENPHVTNSLFQIRSWTNSDLEGGKKTATIAQDPSTSKEVKQELIDKHRK